MTQQLHKSAIEAQVVRRRQAVCLRIAHLEEANAKEKALKDKKQDKDYIEDNTREIKELTRQQDEINDKRRELLEAEEEWKKTFTENFGGVLDYASIADEWVDAWIQAFEESGSGLESLEDKFDDFMKNLIKKQVVYKGASEIMKGLMTVVNNAIGDDGDITDNEWSQIMEESEDTLGDLDDFLTEYSERLQALGISLQSKDGSLSGLQKGIQGITEDQADILAAYWSQVRTDVSAIRYKFEEYTSKMFSEGVNPIVEAIKTQTSIVTSIKETLSNAISDSESTAIRVKVLNM